MPKFYLHLYDGDVLIKDPDGQNFSDTNAAVAEAEAAAREMLAEKVRAGEVIDGQRIEIVDENGLKLATVPFREQLRLDDATAG